MKQVVILRDKTTWQGTPGWLFIGGAEFCRTLELPWRDNKPNLSCVPVGEYWCDVYQSPKHGSVYLLQDVPGRTFCEIHPYNWAGAEDHGYTAEAEGCTALGSHITKTSPQMMIHDSHETVGRFMLAMGGKRFLLQIGGVDGWEKLA